MNMTPVTAVARTALGLATVHLFVGLAMGLLGNPEGPLGGVAYAVFYALPLLLIGLALRSSRRGYHVAAGVGALILGAFYAITVVGNWTFYSTEVAIFSAGITIPTVAVDLLVAWATLLHRPGRARPSTPTTA
jgi:hypothetical protein